MKPENIEVLKIKEFLSVRDVATLLNCSVRTTYRLIEQGSIKAVNLSQRKTLIKRSEIDKLFNQPIPVTLLCKSVIEPALNDISDYYTLLEIQNKYGISASALNHIIKRENIPKLKNLNHIYVPKNLIDELLR